MTDWSQHVQVFNALRTSNLVLPPSPRIYLFLLTTLPICIISVVPIPFSCVQISCEVSRVFLFTFFFFILLMYLGV